MRRLVPFLHKQLCSFLYLLILVFFPASLLSQQAQPSGTNTATSQAQTSQTSIPTLKVTTRLVVVDVVATDHKGHAVTDLKQDDFSLMEEGSSQAIKMFSFQSPGQVEAAAQPLKVPANMF